MRRTWTRFGGLNKRAAGASGRAAGGCCCGPLRTAAGRPGRIPYLQAAHPTCHPYSTEHRPLHQPIHNPQPLRPAPTWGLTSGITSGTSGTMRNALLLSTTCRGGSGCCGHHQLALLLNCAPAHAAQHQHSLPSPLCLSTSCPAPAHAAQHQHSLPSPLCLSTSCPAPALTAQPTVPQHTLPSTSTHCPAHCAPPLTVQPAAEAMGAYFLEMEPPAEKSAMSQPLKLQAGQAGAHGGQATVGGMWRRASARRR